MRLHEMFMILTPRPEHLLSKKTTTMQICKRAVEKVLLTRISAGVPAVV